MHYPFLVTDPRSGLQYRLTDTGLAELSLAPISAEWAPGRAIAEAPDPVWAESLANAPVETISAVTAALTDLVLATPDLKVPNVDHLPDSRAKRHLLALVALWQRLGDALPEGLAPISHVLVLPHGSFLGSLPVVEGSLDPLAPAALQALFARLRDEFGTVPASAYTPRAAIGSRLHALQGGVSAQDIEAGVLDDSLAFYGLRDPAACADFAAAQARALIESGVSAREIAVLSGDDLRQIARAFSAQGVPLSGLSGQLPERDVIGETALHLALAKRPPTPAMVLASLALSPLMPWAAQTGRDLAESLMGGDFRGAILTGTPAHKELWDDIRASAGSLPQLRFLLDRICERIGKGDQVRARLTVPPGEGAPDWEIILRGIQVAPPMVADPDRNLEGVSLWSAHESPWRPCRHLIVSDFTDGLYPTRPRANPLFLDSEIAAIRAGTGVQLRGRAEGLAQSLALLAQQLQAVSGSVTFLIPWRDLAGGRLQPSAGLSLAARAVAGVEDASDLITDLSRQSPAEWPIAYHRLMPVPEPAELPEGLAFPGHDLLSLRRRDDGTAKPQSPSRLETLLVSPLAWFLDAVYGPVLDDPIAATTALQTAVQGMIAAFPEGGMAGITAKTNVEKLEKNLALFKRVDRAPDLLDRDWQVWNDLRSLFISNRSSKTPAGYDDLATAIMAAADVLPCHPGPLADAKLHLSCLIACAQEVMAAYETRKKALGLIDFADMITGAEHLLRTDLAVRQAVLDEIDCVIIDEFQDTNPVQFALLWQLGQHAPRTLLVGDVKQSIMGFQGADPRLSTALAAANLDATQPLDRNWRSTPAVMQFVNAMGAGLFGDGYNPLAPTRDAVAGPAIEVLNVVKSRGVRTASKPQEHIAERIARILTDGDTITDRHSKAARPARPSDIALLVCRHTTAARYAEELRARGVPVRIAEDGWAQSAVIVAARAALAFAANPADIHAGLLLRTLGPDPLPLQDALSAQIDGRLVDDPVLMRLAALSDILVRLPLGAGLDLVLDAADLRLWAERQPDAAQSRADLLRLEAEAGEFEAAHRDLKSASGFHGETAKVFLGWLDARAGERDFDRHPDPSANSAEAVEIVTWHASKGREWPITVVAEFDYGIEERAGSTATRFDALDRIDDMVVVLGSASLIHTPGFDAPEATRRFIEDRRADFEANAKNLLYVALTRARDRLVLEWPGFLKDREEDAPEATNLFHILSDTCAPQIGAGSLRINGLDCPALITQLPEEAGFTEYAGGAVASALRFGAAAPLPVTPLTPWRLQPSQTRSAGVPPVSRRINIGAPWPKALNDAYRGTALHLALRTYLTRPDLAPALALATGLDDATLALVAERATALKAWLVDQGYTDLRAEIPVLGHTPEGAEIPGTLDLLAIGPAGAMLIDHKSGGGGDGFGPYWPQLSSYAGLLAGLYPQHPLQGVAVFWVDHGWLELADKGASAGAFAQARVN